MATQFTPPTISFHSLATAQLFNDWLANHVADDNKHLAETDFLHPSLANATAANTPGMLMKRANDGVGGVNFGAGSSIAHAAIGDNGLTFIGIASQTGYFWRAQIGASVKALLDAAGNFTANSFNGQIVGTTGNFSGALNVAGGTTLAAALTATSAAFSGTVSSIGFTGPLTGDVAGNATGVKGVTAGGLLIGAGAGAMTTLAAGTNLFVLTSNGAGVAPSWQANGGGGGGGTTADTGLYATQGTNDAPLSDFLKLTVTGNIVGAVVPGGTAGTLTLSVGSGQPPIVFEGWGRRQKAEFGHAMPVSNAVTTAGIYTLLADLSGATPYVTGLVLTAGVVTSSNNQVPIQQVYFDGTAFYARAKDGAYYPMQPVIGGANFEPIHRLYVYADTATLAAGGPTVLPSPAPPIAITVNLGVQGLTAHVRVFGNIVAPASPGDFRVYPAYSAGAGTTLANLTQYAKTKSAPASSFVPFYVEADITNLPSGPNNFGIFYFATLLDHQIVFPTISVDITR